MDNPISPAPPIDPHVVSAFRDVPTCHVSDALGRTIASCGLTRYNQTGKLLGTALTVKTAPGDNLSLYRALTTIAPGHVLVIDAEGDTSTAILGELIATYAMSRGCAGFVVDGAIRDVASFASIPCYARGISHRGPSKNGPGEVNIPVMIGGMTVDPGDLVIGDEDGVIAVPRTHLQAVLDRVAAVKAREEAIRAEITSGFEPQNWIQTVLNQGNR